TSFGAPRVGVKSGCNAALLVKVKDSAREIATVIDDDGFEAGVELSMLRPALRGDGVVEWTRPHVDDWIVWTHDERGAPLARLPVRAHAWLRRHHGPLAGRVDA